MPKEVLNGIVLRTVDYKESDRILSVFTKEQGLITVSARGCRQGSKLAAVSTQFCYGELEIGVHAGRMQLSSGTVLESFYPIRESYEHLCAASAVVRSAERMLTEGIANESLFILVYNTLSLLAYGENDPIDLELCYIAKLLRLGGYTPVLTTCVRCGKDLRQYASIRFASSLGGCVCEDCGGHYTLVSALSMEALRRMLIIDISDMKKVRLPEHVRNELKPLLIDYAGYVFDFEIK